MNFEPEVFGVLKENGLTEVAHISTFRGKREGKEVQVEIFDYGPTADPAKRYYANATANGKTVPGILGDSIVGVLMAIHWYDLDEKTPAPATRPKGQRTSPPKKKKAAQRPPKKK